MTQRPVFVIRNLLAVPGPRELGALNPRGILLLCAVAVIFLAMMLPFYKNVKTKAQQAEAKVVLSHIATLESLYFIDANRYAYFSEFYGAQIAGVENCERPAGAVELGLVLNMCKKDYREGGLRYAYRVIKPETATKDSIFSGEAISGSDINGLNLACQNKGEEERWEVGIDRQPKQIAPCKK